MDITASSSQNNTTNAPKLSEVRKRCQEEDHCDDDEFLEKKRRREKNAANLPPEYDANDSRWTLKYREPAPGLVELMEHSRVYVNADKLAEYKRLSNYCKILAELLLTEVFSTSALSTCSVTAVKGNHTNVRPTLDKNAVTTLLKFLAVYGLEKEWKVCSNKLMRYILRQRVRKIRKDKRDERLNKKRLQRLQERKDLSREYDDND